VLIDHIDIHNRALLLDVDGTILDIAATPREVTVPSRLKQALAKLEEETKGALAFVSGRSLADLDRLFAPLRLRRAAPPPAAHQKNRLEKLRRAFRLG